MNGERPRVGKTMVAVNGENHLLAKQGNRVNALVRLLAWQGVDGDLEIASQKPRAQVLCTRIAKFQLDLGVTGANIGDEINDFVWRDRAHDPQFERPLFRELPRQALRQPRVV